jgi:hypothetical protein
MLRHGAVGGHPASSTAAGHARQPVPVEESRQFVRAAKELGLPVQYVEVEGQGHAIAGLELQVKVYRARFDFLKADAKAAPPAEEAQPPARTAESGS